ncbi:uncharacterized protein LOC127841674 isoform X1 [Dreissena polymorpha]|uniref:Transmembrane protein n=1 Tax=Dreissena polymorpha TaxID=45954 RepID=A0A9D4EYQ4_DREPO|nr:uncharacterized protein LOC127841674 isoform X1 [Dreissena polymorpha]KAH3786435.1 hypothetical protein DPMN_164542 [Dreissena polymorpha]
MARGNGGAEGCAICGAVMICCGLVIVVLLGLGLGIAKIVMGAVHLHDCPLEHMIPIWLIVSGVAPVFFGCSGRRNNDDSGEKSGGGCAMILGIIGLLFNMAWLICGSVWIYPNFGKMKADDFIPCTENITTGCTKDCHQPLLNFSVAMVTIDWMFFVAWSVLIGCTIRAACASRNQKESILHS